MRDKVEAPEVTARRVLGHAVHPQALARLFELWPEAQVKVMHSTPTMVPRFTVVSILRDPDSAQTVGHVTRHATCGPGDIYSRRYGITLAFRRALREVSNRCKEGAA